MSDIVITKFEIDEKKTGFKIEHGKIYFILKLKNLRIDFAYYIQILKSFHLEDGSGYFSDLNFEIELNIDITNN